MRAVLRLLKLIGKSVMTLHVKFRVVSMMDDIRLDAASIQALFTACPQLQSMRLKDLQLDSFDSLLRFGSRLQSLSLWNVSESDIAGYEEFLRGLISGRMKLTELSLRLPMGSSTRLAQGLRLALDHNPQLERLRLAKDDLYPAVNSLYSKDLAKRNGTVLAIQDAMLPVQCKLAFLSVLPTSGSSLSRETRAKRHRRALTNLDTAVIEIIFQFAAPLKLRACGLVG